jgi:hypothetical protein
MNLLIAWLIYWGLTAATGFAVSQPQVGGVLPQSAAEAAGLKPGDMITAIDGVKIERWGQVPDIVGESGGKTMQVAKIDYEKCNQCRNGAVVNRFSPKAKPDRIAALCNRSCMCALEERDALSKSFENKFRTSPIWSIGGSDQGVDHSDEQANVLGGAFSKTGKRGH